MSVKGEYVRAEAAKEPARYCAVKHPQGWSCDRPQGHAGNHRAAHSCHWPGCVKQVPPAMWGCKVHWFRLPLAIRNRIWAHFQPGQEIAKTPSRAYLEAAEEAQVWIAAERRK